MVPSIPLIPTLKNAFATLCATESVVFDPCLDLTNFLSSGFITTHLGSTSSTTENTTISAHFCSCIEIISPISLILSQNFI